MRKRRNEKLLHAKTIKWIKMLPSWWLSSDACWRRDESRIKNYFSFKKSSFVNFFAFFFCCQLILLQKVFSCYNWRVHWHIIRKSNHLQQYEWIKYEKWTRKRRPEWTVFWESVKGEKNEIKIKRTPEMHKDADYGDDAIYWKDLIADSLEAMLKKNLVIKWNFLAWKFCSS